MSVTFRNYYEVLGVPDTASLDEIKKRYREMARQYHPDVNRSKPDAAQRFAEITTAYKVLSDKEARATYDAEANLLRQRRNGATRRQTESAPFTATVGRTSATPRPTPKTATASDEARLVAEAQNAFARGNFIQARSLSEQALRVNRRSAIAYEILGDIFRLQGKNDDAVSMYSMSLQINPRNTTVMQRLERVARSTPSRTANVNVNFESQRAQNAPGYTPRPVRARVDNRSLGSLLTGLVGYGLVFVIVLCVALFGGEPFNSRQNHNPFLVFQWNWTVILSLSLCGIVLGVTMAVTSVVQRIGEELVFSPVRNGRFQLPIGLLITVVALFSFWAAALLHILHGLLRESLSVSMVRVFGAVLAVVMLMAAVYEPGRAAVAALGGNLVFLGLLLGWWLGDFFRTE